MTVFWMAGTVLLGACAIAASVVTLRRYRALLAQHVAAHTPAPVLMVLRTNIRRSIARAAMGGLGIAAVACPARVMAVACLLQACVAYVSVADLQVTRRLWRREGK